MTLLLCQEFRAHKNAGAVPKRFKTGPTKTPETAGGTQTPTQPQPQNPTGREIPTNFRV